MASIPGYCTHCGTVFEGRGGVHFEGSTNIRMIGNTMTCPGCGRMANMVDGVFNERGEGLEIVSAPPITHAVIDRLRQIAEQTRRGEISPEEAVQQLGDVDPKLAAFFSKFHDMGLPYLSFFVALVALYLQISGSASEDEYQTRAIQMMERQTIAVETMARSHNVHNESRVKGQRERPATEKANRKLPTIKDPSQRRKHVRDKRAKALKERREAFVPRPTPRPTH